MRYAVSFVSVALAAAAGSVALTLTGTHVMSKEPRFPQLTMGQLADAQKPLAEEIMKVSSVGLGGPYNPLLRSPVRQVVDLTTVAGTYISIAMVLAMSEETLPAGKELPFTPGEP